MQTKPWNPPCAKDASICTNTPGSYNCRCKKGFKGDGKTCNDIDECLKVPSVCPGKNNLCINKPGTYVCRQLTCPPTVFADVALVLDTHNQIGPYNLKFVQEFARKLVQNLEVGANATSLSVTAYSGEKVTPMYFLSDTAVRGKDVALQAIGRIKHVGYGLRLEKAMSFLLNFSFLPAMGRKKDRPGIAIILAAQKTDSLQSLKFMEPAIRRAEGSYPSGKDLTFIAVGVDKAEESELKIIAGKDENIHMAGEWKNLASDDFVNKILGAVCKVTGM